MISLLRVLVPGGWSETSSKGYRQSGWPFARLKIEGWLCKMKSREQGRKGGG